MGESTNKAMDDKLNELISMFEPENKHLIAGAYDIARLSLSGLERENHHPFIEHPLNVAMIVASEIGLRADAVASVFLHEASRGKDSMVEEFKKNYPKGDKTAGGNLPQINCLIFKRSKGNIN